jgi:hypothetical protein
MLFASVDLPLRADSRAFLDTGELECRSILWYVMAGTITMAIFVARYEFSDRAIA